jgi:hypothetical protein
LLCYDKASDSIITYMHKDDDSNSLVSNILNKLYLDRDGNLLVGHGTGIKCEEQSKAMGFTNIVYHKMAGTFPERQQRDGPLR